MTHDRLSQALFVCFSFSSNSSFKKHVSIINQSQKDKYSIILLIWGYLNSQNHGNRKQNGGCLGLGGGAVGSYCLIGTEF